MSKIIGVDEKLPIPALFLYGLQHVLAMFSGIVAVPLMVGAALKLPGYQMTILVQGALFTSGLGTIVQCLGIGKIGARLPICMGTAFVFLSPFISVGTELGISSILGGAIVGGISGYIFSFYVGKIQSFFPPIVTGTVVILIGSGLLPLAFGWFAGSGTSYYGQPVSFFIGTVVLVLLVVMNQYGRGLGTTLSVALSIAIGYIISDFAGILDLSLVGNSSWIEVPALLAFGMPTFSLAAVVAILVAQLAAIMETIGDTYATGLAVKRPIGTRELVGSLSADGIMSAIAVLFNGFPITSFSQNIGVIVLTNVASRFAVAAGGIILVVLGFFPKFAAIISCMPQPVLGGASLIMFGAIAGSGVSQLRSLPEFGQRETMILATSLSLGLGFGLHPAGSLDMLPPFLGAILKSGVAVGGITAILLNFVLPAARDSKTAQ